MVVKGKVDDWRIDRRNFFLIHRSLVEKPVDMLSELPLPFDDELREAESDLSDWQIYQLAKDTGYFKTPLN